MMPLRCKAATELEKMTIWWLLSRDWEKSGGGAKFCVKCTKAIAFSKIKHPFD
jgi:hypothetical protein